jgi:Zn-dependent peptidase ImmA (M78 family)
MPQINPIILAWARETSGLDIEDAAKKLQLKDTKTASATAKLKAYESGEVEPSRSLLQRMAKQYRRPLLTFYLDRPPEKGDKGEDFRTLPESVQPTENAQVDALIRDIRARQSILRDTLIDEDEAVSHGFIGSMSTSEGAQKIADSIRQTISFDIAAYRDAPNTGEAFKYLRSKVEDIGVFVILAGNLGSHHSNIDTTIFRGFVVSDEFAPFIVINDQDSKSAWSFTLLHEMAHLWLGQTGVSGSLDENMIERLCNDVAAEILLSADQISLDDFRSSDFSELAEKISDYARAVNVSSSMLAYRLLSMEFIDTATWKRLAKHYKNLWLEYKARERAKNRAKDGGPSPYVIRRHKLGNALLGFTTRMVKSGALSTTKAATLLGVRPIGLHKLLG